MRYQFKYQHAQLVPVVALIARVYHFI